MAAGSYDLTIEQGATSRLINVTDGLGTIFPLTGYTAQAQIRSSYSASSVLASLTCTINEAAGSVTLSLTAAQTAALPVIPAIGNTKLITSYPWDLILTAPNTSVIRLLEGEANVSPGVTR